MQTARKRPASARSRAARSDGTQTRLHILEVAGRLYAEKGFSSTTSKEICAQAGTNMAAVNYHFGSKEGLYEAVLLEAHRQVVSLDELEAIAGSGGSAEQRLEAVLVQIVARAAAANAPWGLRVLVREMMSPSRQAPALIRQAIVPKARVVSTLIGEVLGVPPGHAAVQRALAFVLLPAIVMVVAPRELRQQVLPALGANPAELADDLVRYVSAGLRALRCAHAPASRG